MRNRRVRTLLQAALVLIILFFWGKALARSWDELAAYPWRLDWPWLLGSMALLLAQMLLLATIWQRALVLMGTPAPWRLAASLWLKTQIARYLPGGVWDVAGRLALGYEEGLSVRGMSASVGLEMGLQVLSASLFLLLVPFLRAGTAVSGYLPLVMALAAAALIVLLPPVFSRLVNFGLRTLRRPPLAMQLTYGNLLLLFAARVVGHLMLGAGFVMFARGVTANITWLEAPAMAASYVGAWLVGYLALVVPMGIGVREGVLALLLQGLFPFAVLSALALGYRTWLLFRDLISAVIGFAIAPRRGPVQVAASPQGSAEPRPANR